MSTQLQSLQMNRRTSGRLVSERGGGQRRPFLLFSHHPRPFLLFLIFVMMMIMITMIIIT